jgi:hypothetical protein
MRHSAKFPYKAYVNFAVLVLSFGQNYFSSIFFSITSRIQLQLCSWSSYVNLEFPKNSWYFLTLPTAIKAALI